MAIDKIKLTTVVDKIRIVFFSSGDFAIPTLTKLLEEKYNVVGIVTSNDKVRYNEYRISDMAVKYNIPYLISPDFSQEEVKQWLIDKDADLFVVISYKFLPENIYTIPKIAAFNVHASLLPFLKGAAPINWAIYHGFKETGLTAILLNNKIDCGNIIGAEKVNINPTDTFYDLFHKLALLCSAFTIQMIHKFCFNMHVKNESIPQMSFDFKNLFHDKNDIGKCNNPFIAPKLNSINTKIKWNTSLQCIYDQIRAFTPYPGALATINIRKYNLSSKVIRPSFTHYKVKILSAHIIDDFKVYNIQPFHNRSNIITDKKTYLYYYPNDDSDECDRVLSIDKIQLEGKKPLLIHEFLNGFRGFDNDPEFHHMSANFY